MKRKPGPKNELAPTVKTRQRTFTLDERTVMLLGVIGGGNMSKGVRIAADFAYERYQREWLTTKNPPAP